MGPRNFFNNYRPVSILSAISKVFEKLLYEQLYDYFVSSNLLSDRQFGFRQFHSTASTLLDSTHESFINMERGKINIAVFLNLQKAFDTINHDILLKKLETYGMGSLVLNLKKLSNKQNSDVLSKWRIVLFKSSYVWSSSRLVSWSTSIFNLYKRFTG